jgi:hypothetical protein
LLWRAAPAAGVEIFQTLAEQHVEGLQALNGPSSCASFAYCSQPPSRQRRQHCPMAAVPSAR